MKKYVAIIAPRDEPNAPKSLNRLRVQAAAEHEAGYVKRSARHTER